MPSTTPTGDQNNHPDLLIRCEDYDILFEHKVDSQLGPNQLERYLSLAAGKNWKFSVLAARPLDIPPEIAADPQWLSPRDGVVRHFLWQDVHQLLATCEHHIAREFREFLSAMGLARFEWAGLGDPFIHPDAGDELRSLYREIDPIFAGPGVLCRGRPNSLTYEVRKPFPPVHLINVSPIASVGQWDNRIWGSVMALSVCVKREGDLSVPVPSKIQQAVAELPERTAKASVFRTVAAS